MEPTKLVIRHLGFTVTVSLGPVVVTRLFAHAGPAEDYAEALRAEWSDTRPTDELKLRVFFEDALLAARRRDTPADTGGDTPLSLAGWA